jgi:DNA-binding transcriptional regulator LsrR (DeoR family)
MSKRPALAATGPDELVMATRVARRYFLDERSKSDIAAEFGISRFKVARLLDLARSSGIVSISITGPGSLDLPLSDRLIRRFGLRHAVVVSTSTGDDARVRRQLGEVAANLLTEIATPEDVLGIGWARAVLEMVTHLRDLQVSQVVQLTGALTRPDVEVSATELVRDVARRARARSSVFYAPMIVSDPAAAKALARQQQIMDAFARFDSVTKAVIGVGGWNPPSSTLHEALSPPERDLMRRSGVHADLSGALLDARGRPLDTPLSKRIIAISARQLRRIPNVIGIAYGLEKASAAHAAIRGGYLNSLVTHTTFAERLLELSDSAETPLLEGENGRRAVR